MSGSSFFNTLNISVNDLLKLRHIPAIMRGEGL